MVDNEPPQIIAPANINTNTDPGLPTAIVTYIAPVGTDNTPGQSTVQIAGLASGSAFPIGVTTNTFQVTDAALNTASDSFTVTVIDNEAPVLTIPADVTLEAPADTSVLALGSATATDNSGLAPEVIFSDATTTGSGQILETIVRTWTATDASGNSVSADQTIVVQDTISPSPPDAPTTAVGPLINKFEESTGFDVVVPLGTSEAVPGDTMELLLDGFEFFPRITHVLVLADIGGSVTLNVGPGQLGGNEGDKSITATITDTNGNTGSQSGELSLTLDTLEPDTPIITDPLNLSTLVTFPTTVRGTGSDGERIFAFITDSSSTILIAESDGTDITEIQT